MRRAPFLAALWLLSLTFLIAGCQTVKRPVRTAIDRGLGKLSFTSWNLRAMVGRPREASCSRAFNIASLSNDQLYRLLCTRPAPAMESLHGHWNGINKGLGSTMFGIMQDVKVIECNGCSQQGYNIMVNQVPICALASRGWRAQRDPRTCEAKTMGNFVVVHPTGCGELGNAIKLDYSLAMNSPIDPSRFLVDDLVEIESGLLLGRANAKFGSIQIPIAYFVLERASDSGCDGNSSEHKCANRENDCENDFVGDCDGLPNE